MVRRNTESDDFARRVGLGAKPGELLSVLKHMVGRKYDDDRLWVARSRRSGRGPNSGGATTPIRLEQDRRLSANLAQLLGDAKPVVDICDDDRRIRNRADDRLKLELARPKE
jgi:hypothetical protein